MKVKKTIALLLVFVLVTAAFAACAGSSKDKPDASSPAGDSAAPESAGGSSEPVVNDDPQPIEGKDTLYIGQINQLGTFQHGSFGGVPTLYSLVFDCLFCWDGATGEMYSDILEDWYFEDDYTYIMKLKEGVTFSDGTPMTGEDILFTLESYELKGSPFVDTAAFVNFEKSAVSDDGLTVTIVCDYTYSPVFYVQPIPVVSKAWCETNGWETQDWYNSPYGSGPYVVSEYVADSHVTMKLRDNYWGDEKFPYETIVAKYYSEAATMYIDLEAGVIDLAVGVNKEDYSRALSGDSENIAADHCLGDYFSVQMWNPNNEYLKNAEIRKALNMAIDWPAVVDITYGELATYNPLSVPIAGQYYDASLESNVLPYDPEGAKAILEAQGVGDGDIQLTMLTTTNNEDYSTTVQYYLAQVGVTLNIEYMDFVTMQMTLFSSEDPTLINFFGGPGFSNPMGTLVNTLPSTTTWPQHTFVGDQAYIDLLEAIKATVDFEEQKALYSELQKYVAENVPFTPVCTSYAGIAYNTNVIAQAKFTNSNDINYRQIVYK
jgi:ABC-type transport system substrate-binding protein